MDRRAAIKKLGIGSGLAVTAPIVLDIFPVSAAASAVDCDNPPSMSQPVADVPDPALLTAVVTIVPATLGGGDFVWTIVSNPDGAVIVPNGSQVALTLPADVPQAQCGLCISPAAMAECFNRFYSFGVFLQNQTWMTPPGLAATVTNWDISPQNTPHG